jgi:glyoxylase-like metal-dependent hydrolase (beta-lactamase superfamily II)
VFEHVRDGVRWAQLGPRAPLRQNVFLVDDGELTLVDAGAPWDGPALRRALDDLGYGVADIDRVLVTHYDLDHVGGLRGLVGTGIADQLSAPVYVGRRDLRLERGSFDPPLVHHKGLFHRLSRRLLPMPDGLEYRPLTDGDDVGGFRAFHTPGHNPGHVAYLHEGLSTVFLGDLVWEGDDGGLTTPIRMDSYDMATLADSVRALAERVPAFETACMGHGTPLATGGVDALRALAASLDG